MAVGPVITQGLGSFSGVEKIVTLGYTATQPAYSLQVQARQVYVNDSVRGTVQPPKTILEISHELR